MASRSSIGIVQVRSFLPMNAAFCGLAVCTLLLTACAEAHTLELHGGDAAILLDGNSITDSEAATDAAADMDFSVDYGVDGGAPEHTLTLWGAAGWLRPDAGVFHYDLVDLIVVDLSRERVHFRSDGVTGIELTLVPPRDETLDVGVYEDVVRVSFMGAGHAGLRLAIGARACNEVAGRFIVQRWDVDAVGSPTRVVILGSHRCDNEPDETSFVINWSRVSEAS